MIEHILIAGFAGWRASRLLVYEAGPGNLFGRIRAACGVPDGPGEIRPLPFLGPLVSCVPCASVWLSAAAWGIGAWLGWMPVAIAAACGVALMLEIHVKE